MNILDMRTIIVLSVITNIICTLFIVQLWRQNRRRFAGMVFWVLDFVFQALALVLIILRGAIPDWMSMVLSNTLVIAGAILGFMGLERFLGKIGPQIHNYMLLAFFIIVHSYFILVQPSLAVRNLNLSVVLLLVCFQCLWLLWRRIEPGLRSLTFGVGVVFFLYCLVSVVRSVQFLIGAHAENNYFQSGLFESLVLVSYQVLFILLTYSLVLMVNKRLLMQIGTQEEKFAKAFHSAPYAITITRLSDGTVVDVNESFVAITGYDRAEVLGEKTMDLHIWEHEEDRAAVVDALSRNGRVHAMELRFRNKSGEAVTGLFSAEIITIDGEKNILASISDITDRRRIEEALQESEAQYRALVESASDIVFRTDGAGHFTFINPAALRITGYEEKEIIGRHYPTLIRQDMREEAMKFFGRQFVKGIPNTYSEYPVIVKDGREIWLGQNTQLIFQDGKVMAFQAVARDITDRKRIEDELKESEEKFRLLAASAHDAIITMDHEGTVFFWNDAAEKMFGYANQEAMGKNCHRLIVPSRYHEAYEKGFDVFKNSGQGAAIGNTLELEARKKDGMEFPVELSLSSIRFHGEWSAVGIIRDITERKRMEKELQDSENRYHELSIVDDLTQLFNSRHFYFQLKSETERSNRYEQPLTLLLLDLDNFKTFNDAYGHVEGDQVLRRLGQVVKRCLRETDFAYRYGGEEFTILLPMTTSADGAVTAERIRTEFKKETFSPAPGQDVHVTVSIGLAQYKPQEEMKTFVHRVDQLMYQGKKNGKDRVCSEP